MKTAILVLVAALAAACSGESRHVMTDKDVEAVDQAKVGAKGDTTWTDTEQTQHALTCIANLGPPFYGCIEWSRTPPSGAFDCGTDTYAYGGEFLFTDRTNFAAGGSGHVNCAGYNHGSNPAGLAGLGDYNDIAVAVKNNTGVEIHGYRDANFGQNVQFFPSNGQTVNNLSSPYNGQMSSFRH
jgi:hypothetical protein